MKHSQALAMLYPGMHFLTGHRSATKTSQLNEKQKAESTSSASLRVMNTSQGIADGLESPSCDT